MLAPSVCSMACGRSASRSSSGRPALVLEGPARCLLYHGLVQARGLVSQACSGFASEGAHHDPRHGAVSAMRQQRTRRAHSLVGLCVRCALRLEHPGQRPAGLGLEARPWRHSRRPRKQGVEQRADRRRQQHRTAGIRTPHCARSLLLYSAALLRCEMPLLCPDSISHIAIPTSPFYICHAHCLWPGSRLHQCLCAGTHGTCVCQLYRTRSQASAGDRSRCGRARARAAAPRFPQPLADCRLCTSRDGPRAHCTMMTLHQQACCKSA